MGDQHVGAQPDRRVHRVVIRVQRNVDALHLPVVPPHKKSDVVPVQGIAAGVCPLQYLHDLFWNFHDDPYADESKAECICAFASELAGGSSNLTPKHSVYSKADCTKYLIKELNLPEDIFLLPIVMEYPILDRSSIKFAIDSIQQVEQTYPDMVKEYVTNLNRKYKEFGCTYQISGNHPYAKYAIPEMVDKVTNLLSEGDTVVSDTDGASEIGSPNNKTDQPWYKRLDYTGTLYRDGSENKEMGPNTKPMQKPDWTQHYSIL